MVSSFNLGGSYKVVKCDACPKLVGRVGVAKRKTIQESIFPSVRADLQLVVQSILLMKN